MEQYLCRYLSMIQEERNDNLYPNKQIIEEIANRLNNNK